MLAEAIPSTAALPPPAVIRSPLRWVGGKSWFVELAGDVLRRRIADLGGAYLEPFVGGAAMALNMTCKQRVLADAVPGLIEFYNVLQRSPIKLYEAVAEIAEARGTDKAGYLAVRDDEPTDPVYCAARFMYLNRLGFNGLYRENAAGKFNVPPGDKVKGNPAKALASLPTGEVYATASAALVGAKILCLDFKYTIAAAQATDFAYVDPPYDGVFDGYSKGGFDGLDQLTHALYGAHELGVKFLCHNARTAAVMERYAEWCHVLTIEEPRRVAANGGRKPASCVLITNDYELACGLVDRLNPSCWAGPTAA